MLQKIPTYKFISFQEIIFSPILLFSPIFLLDFQEISHLYFYSELLSFWNSRVVRRGNCSSISLILLFISGLNRHPLYVSALKALEKVPRQCSRNIPLRKRIIHLFTKCKISKYYHSNLIVLENHPKSTYIHTFLMTHTAQDRSRSFQKKMIHATVCQEEFKQKVITQGNDYRRVKGYTLKVQNCHK